MDAGADERYPGGPAAASATYAADDAEHTHAEVGELAYYAAEVPYHSAASEAPVPDVWEPGRDPHSGSPAYVVADRAEEVPGEAGVRVEEPDPVLGPGGGDVVVDGAATVLHVVYHVAAPAPDGVRADGDPGGTPMEGVGEVARTEDGYTGSGRRVYRSEGTEDVEAAPGDERVLAVVEVVERERRLDGALREESAAGGDVGESDYVES